MDAYPLDALNKQLLADPRIERNKLHKLLDIIVIAICGVICGADTWVDIELFGNKKQTGLRQFLELPHGIPSHDTFGRVFGLLNASSIPANNEDSGVANSR